MPCVRVHARKVNVEGVTVDVPTFVLCAERCADVILIGSPNSPRILSRANAACKERSGDEPSFDRNSSGVKLWSGHLGPSRSVIENLLATLEVAHQPIAHNFGTGIGHKLQIIESTILIKALLDLESAGLVGLPVHDCVVVSRSALEPARRIMEEAAKAITGEVIPLTVSEVYD